MLRAIALTFVLPAVLAGCGASQRDVRALKAQIAELRALLAKSRAQQRALAADVSHLSAALQRFEPARESKLRTLKTDDHELLLKCKLEAAGHGGASGRYDRWKDRAFEMAWMLAQVGVTE